MHMPHLHESSNLDSTRFQSGTEFQSTNGYGSSRSRLQFGLGGIHTRGEIQFRYNSRVNRAIEVSSRNDNYRGKTKTPKPDIPLLYLLF